MRSLKYLAPLFLVGLNACSPQRHGSQLSESMAPPINPRSANASYADTALSDCADDEMSLDFTVEKSWEAHKVQRTAAAWDVSYGYRSKVRILELHCVGTGISASLTAGEDLWLFTDDLFRPSYQIGEVAHGVRVSLTAFVDSSARNNLAPDYSHLYPKTREEFLALSAEMQETILDYGSETTPIAGVTGDMIAWEDLGALAAADKTLAKKVHAKFAAEIGSLEPGEHATVGEPRRLILMLRVKSGELVGGRTWYIQNGCDMPDLSSPHFPDVAAAEAAGCEFSDVEWQAARLFKHNGSLYPADEGWQWAGY